eukprot:2187260-Prymnesium_polylepis.1
MLGSGSTGGRLLAMYRCRMRRRGVWRWSCAARCRRASVGRPVAWSMREGRAEGWSSVSKSWGSMLYSWLGHVGEGGEGVVCVAQGA